MDGLKLASSNLHLFRRSEPGGAAHALWRAALFACLLVGVTPGASIAQGITRSLTLGWTAPGNDGNTGTAASYTLRYATTPLSESNWATATAVPGVPVPLVAGTFQSVGVGGLTPGSTYYFGLKAVDGAGNWSPLSNVLSSVMPSIQPFISGVNPSIAATGSSFTLTLMGTDFQAPDSLWIQRAGFARILATSVSTPASSQVTGQFLVSAAGEGYWDVVVRNPDGVRDTLVNGLYLRLPAPVVTSITPSSAQNTGVVSITNLAGLNFRPGALVQLRRSGQTSLNAGSVLAVTSARITCAVDLTGVAGGSWDVVVQNPDGQSATLSAGFNVTVPTPPPSVLSVVPAVGVQGQVLPGVAISGGHFFGPDSVWISQGPTRVVAQNVVVNSASSVVCQFPLAGAATGIYSLTVKNPDGQSSTLASAFTIQAPLPAPSVTAFSPANAFRGQVLTGAQVTGANFAAPDSVILTNGAVRIVGTGVQTLSSGLLQCNLDLSSAATGSYQLQVRNPDGQSATLNAALDVQFAPNSGPAVTSVTPGQGTNEGSAVLTFNGANFVTGASVALVRSGQGTITGTGVSVQAGSRLVAAFALAGAATGGWDAYVQNPDAQSTTLAQAFRVVLPPPTLASITPTSGTRNVVVAVVAGGSGFVGPNAMYLSGPGGRLDATGLSTVSSTQLSAQLNLGGAVPGSYDVVLLNSDGSADTLFTAFAVKRRKPSATSLGTGSGLNVDPDFQLTVHGLALDEADTVYLGRGTQRILANSRQILGDTLLTAHFDLRGSAAGSWLTVVKNGDGDSSGSAPVLNVTAPVAPAVVLGAPFRGCAGDSVDCLLTVQGSARPDSAWMLRGAERRYAVSMDVQGSRSPWQVRARFSLRQAAAGVWTVGVTDSLGLTGASTSAFQVDWPGFTGADPRSRRSALPGQELRDSVQLSNSSGCPVVVRASSSAGWLTVSPDSIVLVPGTAPAFGLALSAVGLARGSYVATLRLTSADPLVQGITISETLQVAQPRLAFSPAGVRVRVLEGQGLEARVSFDVSNPGDAPLHYRASAQGTAVRVGVASGVLAPGAAETDTIVWNADGLAPGIYAGSIQLDSDDPSRPGVALPETLEVQSRSVSSPFLVADSTAYHLHLGDAQESASRTLVLANLGSAPGSFRLLHSHQWLQASADTGTVAAAGARALGIQFSALGLAGGAYRDTLEVQWGSGPSQWLKISVRLDVERVASSPLLCPAEVSVRWVGTMARLRWTRSADPRVQSYRVLRRSGFEAYARLADVSGDSSGFGDVQADTTRSWEYRVDPLDVGGSQNEGCGVASLPAKPEGGAAPPRIAAAMGYPNPFVNQLRVQVDVPASGHSTSQLRVTLWDATHRRVALIFDGAVPAGRRVLDWDAGALALAPGIYRLSVELDGTQVSSDWVARKWAR